MYLQYVNLSSASVDTSEVFVFTFSHFNVLLLVVVTIFLLIKSSNSFFSLVGQIFDSMGRLTIDGTKLSKHYYDGSLSCFLFKRSKI